MIPTQILRMLNLFDLNGYNSGCSKLSKNKRYAYAIYVVHISVAAFLSMYIFHMATKYFARLKLSEAISECLQFTAALYTYWLIIFDSILHCQTHERFWSTLQLIDKNFCTQTKMTLRNYFAKLIIYLIKTIITVVVRLMGNSFASFDIDAPYVIIFIICDVRMFYYLFCLEIVHFQLEMIETESEKLKTTVERKIIESRRCRRSEVRNAIASTKFQQMKWMREYLHCVHEMVCLANQIFGWSNVAAISLCFCLLLTEIHWYYNNIGTTFTYKFSRSIISIPIFYSIGHMILKM